MSAIATPNTKTGAMPIPALGEDRAEVAVDSINADHGLPRFFFAAGVALVISAIHGILQRLPVFAEWIRTADYGGHMITNLAQTHITIVGAGTISLTALLYYIMPRLGRRPLYSGTLTSVSFWFTVCGVFGFYLAVLGVGAYEGMMVHAGWQYEAARDYLGAWHKVPIAVTCRKRRLSRRSRARCARPRACKENTMPPSSSDLVKPWDWNFPQDFYLWAWIALMVATIALAAWMGRDRLRLRNDLGRNVEDFAGVQQEANGPLPIYLMMLYVLVAVAMVGYIAITIINGYNY